MALGAASFRRKFCQISAGPLAADIELLVRSMLAAGVCSKQGAVSSAIFRVFLNLGKLVIARLLTLHFYQLQRLTTFHSFIYSLKIIHSHPPNFEPNKLCIEQI